jgi:hypothetical protein
MHCDRGRFVAMDGTLIGPGCGELKTLAPGAASYSCRRCWHFPFSVLPVCALPSTTSQALARRSKTKSLPFDKSLPSVLTASDRRGDEASLGNRADKHRRAGALGCPA